MCRWTFCKKRRALIPFPFPLVIPTPTHLRFLMPYERQSIQHLAEAPARAMSGAEMKDPDKGKLPCAVEHRQPGILEITMPLLAAYTSNKSQTLPSLSAWTALRMLTLQS